MSSFGLVLLFVSFLRHQTCQPTEKNKDDLQFEVFNDHDCNHNVFGDHNE